MKNIITAIIAIFAFSITMNAQQIKSSFELNKKIEKIIMEDGRTIDASNLRNANGQYWWTLEVTYTYYYNGQHIFIAEYDEHHKPLKAKNYSNVNVVRIKDNNGLCNYSIENDFFVFVELHEQTNGNYIISLQTKEK